MTTQNIEYNEIAKTSPIVYAAFVARDDAQEDVDAIKEDMEKLAEQVAERQRALDRKLEALAIADDKLALVATMAQECNERIEEVRKERDESLTLALGSLNSLIEMGDELDGDNGFVSANNVVRERDALALVLGIDLSADDSDQDSEEVQEELALTG